MLCIFFFLFYLSLYILYFFMTWMYTWYAAVRAQDFIVTRTDSAFLALYSRPTNTSTCHLFTIISYRSKSRTAAGYSCKQTKSKWNKNNVFVQRIIRLKLTYTSPISRWYFRQTPITGFTSVAFNTTHPRSAFTLLCLWIAYFRVRSQFIAAAQRGTTGMIWTLCQIFTIRTAAIPTVFATFLLDKVLI